MTAGTDEHFWGPRAHALDGTLTSLLGHAEEYLEKPVRVDTLIATATALIGQGRRPATDAGL